METSLKAWQKLQIQNHGQKRVDMSFYKIPKRIPESSTAKSMEKEKIFGEEEHQDHFDRLPDAILLDIFNKLQDEKILTRCLTVCKRFSSLIPQINSIFLTIPRSQPTSKRSFGLILNSFRTIFSFRKLITKSFKRFRRIIDSKPAASKYSSNSLYHPSLTKALKNFKEVKSMHVQLQLPLSEIGIGSDRRDCLIKWKAEFGRELKSCIILGATSFLKRNPAWENSDEEEENEGPFLTDDQLKLRIVWTISCLISASARHHFVKQIVSDYPNLQNVIITDCNNQGKLSMEEEQLVEVKNSMDVLLQEKSSSERTPVPDLNIRLLYSPVLELPGSGYTMKGATLVVIRPVDDKVIRKEIDGDDFDKDGEKVFGEAVKEMMKMKRSYVMTMNSF